MSITPRDIPRVLNVVVRTYGVKGIARRLRYEGLLRSGYLERVLPVEDNFEAFEDPGRSWALRFDLGEIRRGYESMTDIDAVRERVVADAERTLAGELFFYGWAWRQVSWPPKWHRNPWTGYEYRQDHWTRISEFQPENGDIKDVWEISRLPFTFLLARAFLLTGDDRYPEAWWGAIEDWAEENPPNMGVNWRCGQETSLRGIALQFGLMTFGGHASSTEERRRLVDAILAASVERVVPTMGYALSQRNNHAITEAVFLETAAVGGVAPREVARLARGALREALADQFYEDGWYAQHSFNYQRLALHALLWLDRVRSIAGRSPVAEARHVEAKSRNMLSTAMDSPSGHLPNAGPNDGALLFPLATVEHRDFRPLLLSLGTPSLPLERSPKAAEERIWLRSPTTPSLPEVGVPPRPSHIKVFSGQRAHVMVRTGRARHRLHHDDLLHLDLWIDGSNVIVDPGTYRYTAVGPWENPFRHRRAHNVPYSEGSSVPTLGRFLQLSWPIAWFTGRPSAPGDGVSVFHRTDAGGAVERTIVRRGEHVLVVDHAGGAPFATKWTFGFSGRTDQHRDGIEVHAGPLRASLGGAVTVLEPDASDPHSAWFSPEYACLSPTTAVLVRSAGEPLGAIFSPADGDIARMDARAIRLRLGPATSWLRA